MFAGHLQMFLCVVVLMTKSAVSSKEMGVCMPSEKQMETAVTCITKITGVTEPEAMVKATDNEDVKDKIGECLFTAMHIIGNDGFHADKFEQMVNDMNATEEIKQQIVSIMDGCVSKHDKMKSKEILDCMEKDIEKICAVPAVKSEAMESKGGRKPASFVSSLEEKSSSTSHPMK